jgi:cell division protein FtsB
MNRIILPFLSFLLISLSIAAQVNVRDTSRADSTQKVEVIDSSLKGQYQSLLARSKVYYGFKLISPGRLSAFYQSVADSIKKERAGNRKIQEKVKEQAKTIDTLNSQIKTKEGALASSNQRSDDIAFMGISFAKSTYNTIVWTIIVVLALALILVITRSAKNIHEAKYRTELYEEVSKEYQTYKTKSNEKEKKLARELQDERNKLEEYKNKGL